METYYIKNDILALNKMWHSLFKAKKKIYVALKGISEFWNLESVGQIFLKIIFKIISLKSSQKYKIWVHSLPFFLKKGEKTPNLTKIGCIPDCNFFLLILG